MRAREIPYAYRICADVGRLRKNILETFNVSLRASVVSLHKLPTASCAVCEIHQDVACVRAHISKEKKRLMRED